MRYRVAPLLFVLLALPSLLSLLEADALAHNRSMSYSTWRIDEAGANVEFRVKLLELSRRPPDHAWNLSLPRELQLLSDRQACRPGRATRGRSAPEGWAVFHWRVYCERDGTRTIVSRLMADVAPGHSHFARIDSARTDSPAEASPGPLREHVLVTGRDAEWAIDAGRAREANETSFGAFLTLGVEHIATGFDHLAFVIALLLLATSLREVSLLVTGFTIAHSLTLGLAVLGVVRPQAEAVEAVIGFSIALVAAENGWLLSARRGPLPFAVSAALLVGAAIAALWGSSLSALTWTGLALFSTCHFALLRRTARPARLRALLAFAFGLVHGFGFAGVLMELELPVGRLIPALLGFNLGVELGQLAIVAVSWPLIVLLAQRSRATHRLVAEAGSAAILALGVFWLAGRSF